MAEWEKAEVVDGGGWKSAPIVSEPSAADRVKALQGGLYRGGVAGLAGLPMDTVQNAYNLIKAGVGTGLTAAGRPDLAPGITTGTPLSSEWIAKQMERVGINTSNPRPDDQTSRMLYTGGLVAGGSAAPGMSARSVLPAAAGGAIAGELSDNPLAVGLGAMAPAAAAQAASAARVAIANPKTVSENRDTFSRAGASPTVGMATESTVFRGLENLAAKFPGGVGTFRKFAENIQSKLNTKTNTGVSAEDAGRVIETGIKGTGGFLDRTKAVWQKLDADLSAKVPKDAGIAPTNTLRTLDDLTTPVAGAENTTQTLINPRLVELKKGLLTDIQGSPNAAGVSTRPTGIIPFEALRDIRTRIGSMLDDALVSGVPNGELKRVYASLSKDMEAAAKSAGASSEFTRQNNYYSARMDRIETVLNRALGNGRQPEDIFKTVMPTDPNQSNKLRAVMRSLEPSERQVVADAVVARLGKATPGRQNEVGDAFSSNTFLTNWNRLSPEAKAQLFPDHALRRDLDSIASVSSNMKESAKVFENPSGTAGAAAPYGLVALGALGNIGTVAGLVGGSYGTAKLMTNKNVVNWLATAQKVPPERVPAHLARFAVIYNEEKNAAMKEEIGNLAVSLGSNTQQNQRQ